MRTLRPNKVAAVVTMVALLAQSTTADAGSIDCRRFSARHADLTDVPVALARSIVEVGQSPHYELSMREVRDSRGNAYLPSDVIEAHCLLERMLPARVRRAISQSIRQSGGTDDVSAIALFERLSAVSEKAVDALDPEGEGLYRTIQAEVIQAFGYLSSPRRDAGKFESYVYSLEIYQTRSITTLLWGTYFAKLDQDSLLSTKLEDALRHEDHAFVPPPIPQELDGCSSKLRYRWPSLWFDDREGRERRKVVHVASCSSTNTLWGSGGDGKWSQLDSEAVDEICNYSSLRDDELIIKGCR